MLINVWLGFNSLYIGSPCYCHYWKLIYTQFHGWKIFCMHTTLVVSTGNSISRAWFSGSFCCRLRIAHPRHSLICLIVVHHYLTFLCDVWKKLNWPSHWYHLSYTCKRINLNHQCWHIQLDKFTDLPCSVRSAHNLQMYTFSALLEFCTEQHKWGYQYCHREDYKQTASSHTHDHTC